MMLDLHEKIKDVLFNLNEKLFSIQELQEICWYISRKEHEQMLPTRIDWKPQLRTWQLRKNNINTRRLNNLELIKKMMIEKKTTLPSLRNQDGKKN